MSYYDGWILGATKIIDHGPAWRRYNLAIISEGYRPEEMTDFAEDAREFAEQLTSLPPLDDLDCAINVYRVDVASLESGADDPTACGGTGAAPRTFFDATFCGYGVRRIILVNSGLVEWVAATQVPEHHQVVVIVNSPLQGGSGGAFATVSNAATWPWARAAIHELGHSAFHLGDEYDFLTACDDGNHTYAGPPPVEPNVARDLGPALKWADLVAPTTPLPTGSNPDCATCGTGPPSSPAGTVGAFEGAGYWHCGLYRPAHACMMRDLSAFCPVCEREVRRVLAPFAPKCLAPTFAGSRGWQCLIIVIALLIAALALAPFVWFGRTRCTLKRLAFRIQHCDTGNDDPCVELG
ncbi:MAG: M64 family metallopeptidase [Gemmatimonadetes bacterium]|nr:M64 family metallopeptidase [Gemmatimonadota bacterium]